MAFARQWAGGRADDNQRLNDDFAVLGIVLPDDHKPAAIQPDAPFEVAGVNWEAVDVFCSCATQWRVGGMGGATGLDYPAVESVMRMLDVADHRDCLQRVAVMEREALAEWNRQRDRERANRPPTARRH